MARYKIVSRIKNGKLIQEVFVVVKHTDNPIISRINEILIELNNPELKRFPYKDCYKIHDRVKNRRRLKTSNGKIRKQFGGSYNKIAGGLIPDLDLYFLHIIGLAMSADKLHKRNLEDLKRWTKPLEKSFYEIHPHYLPVKKLISPKATPKLYRQLELHSELGILLIPLISELLNSKEVKER